MEAFQLRRDMDFLQQPLDVRELKFALDAACRRTALSRELAEARNLIGVRKARGRIARQ